MTNYIDINFRGSGKVYLTAEARKLLTTYIPKGCPFNNYTFLDLLLNQITMNDWKYPCQKMTIKEFVKKEMGDNNVYMLAYGDFIIEACEEAA